MKINKNQIKKIRKYLYYSKYVWTATSSTLKKPKNYDLKRRNIEKELFTEFKEKVHPKKDLFLFTYDKKKDLLVSYPMSVQEYSSILLPKNTIYRLPSQDLLMFSLINIATTRNQKIYITNFKGSWEVLWNWTTSFSEYINVEKWINPEDIYYIININNKDVVLYYKKIRVL